jgi:hypothetical protein
VSEPGGSAVLIGIFSNEAVATNGPVIAGAAEMGQCRASLNVHSRIVASDRGATFERLV